MSLAQQGLRVRVPVPATRLAPAPPRCCHAADSPPPSSSCPCSYPPAPARRRCRALADSGVRREEVFVTTKVWGEGLVEAGQVRRLAPTRTCAHRLTIPPTWHPAATTLRRSG